MQRKTYRDIVSASLVALGLVIAVPAFASDVPSTLPTSSSSVSRPWLRMNPTTFRVSPQAVLEQFDRVARNEPRLTAQMRARFAAMLQAGQGVEVMVPDGIGLDYLTGRNNGAPFVYTGMRKQLGRDDHALLFDLGDGVTIYWFTGVVGVSCNNIGVVINTPPPPVALTPQPRPPVYGYVTTRQQILSDEGLFLSPFMLQNCCCGISFTPAFYRPPGSTDTMITTILTTTPGSN